MKHITPGNAQQAFNEIANFLKQGPVNVTNGGVTYGPVRITPTLENKPMRNQRRSGTTTLPVLNLAESDGGASAGELAIYPADSPEGKTSYELHASSLTFTFTRPGYNHKIWLIRP